MKLVNWMSVAKKLEIHHSAWPWNPSVSISKVDEPKHYSQWQLERVASASIPHTTEQKSHQLGGSIACKAHRFRKQEQRFYK